MFHFLVVHGVRIFWKCSFFHESFVLSLRKLGWVNFLCYCCISKLSICWMYVDMHIYSRAHFQLILFKLRLFSFDFFKTTGETRIAFFFWHNIFCGGQYYEGLLPGSFCFRERTCPNVFIIEKCCSQWWFHLSCRYCNGAFSLGWD